MLPGVTSLSVPLLETLSMLGSLPGLGTLFLRL